MSVKYRLKQNTVIDVSSYKYPLSILMNEIDMIHVCVFLRLFLLIVFAKSIIHCHLACQQCMMKVC